MNSTQKDKAIRQYFIDLQSIKVPLPHASAFEVMIYMRHLDETLTKIYNAGYREGFEKATNIEIG